MSDQILPGPDHEEHKHQSWSESLRRRRITRVHLAFLMVFASALGAVVAFWAAIIEQQTSQLQSQLTLGRMTEISHRHLTANDVAVSEALKLRQRNLEKTARGRHKIADQIRKDAPEEAARLDIRGQQEFALSRSVRGLTYALRKTGKGKSTYEALSEKAARHLASLGMGHLPALRSEDASTKPSDEKKRSAIAYNDTVSKLNLRLWDRIEDAISTGHTKVPLLALGVVFFVSALVFFTISDLNDHRRILANLSLLLGSMILLAAAIFVLVVESTIWLPLSVVFLVSGLVGAIGWRNGMLKPAESDIDTSPPNELQPRSFVGAHMLLRVTPHNLSRWTVVFVAISVFFSALVGYWYSQALTDANTASHQAFASQVALNNRVTERNLIATAGGLLNGFDLLQSRIECAFSSQNALFIADKGFTSLANIAKLQRDETCQRLKKGNLARSGEFFDRFNFDTAQNPTWRLLNEIYYREAPNSAQLIALADGYLELSDAFEQKSTIYLLSITLFAIALYLFGQSLGMGTGLASRGLTFCGIVLAGLSGGLSVWTKITPVGIFGAPAETCESPQTTYRKKGPEQHIELAAYYYGKAKPILRVARSGDEYAKAAAYLDCAVAIRKNFALAQYDRGRAHTLTNNVELGNDFISLATKSTLPNVIEARQNLVASLEAAGWSPTSGMFDSIGFDLTLLALSSGKSALLNDAKQILNRSLEASELDEDVSRDEIKKMQSIPVWNTRIQSARSIQFNLAFAHLAAGDVRLAEQAYDVALNVFNFQRLDKKKAFPAKFRAHLAAAITDLNIVAQYCSKIHKEDSEESCPPILKAVGLLKNKVIGSLMPSQVESKAQLMQAQISADPARVSWKANVKNFDPDRDHLEVVWYVLDSNEWNVWRAIPALFDTAPKISYDAKNNVVSATTLYNNSLSNCAPAGKYKAEFYLNGERVDQLNLKTIEVPEYITYRSRELNLSLCYPKGWKVKKAAQDINGRHLVHALANNDGKNAVYLFTFFGARDVKDDARKDEFIERAWTWLKHIFNTTPTDEQFRAAISKFKNCKSPPAKGTLLNKVWIMPDGMTHVSFVIGDFAKREHACRVLESIGNYYERGSEDELKPL